MERGQADRQHPGRGGHPDPHLWHFLLLPYMPGNSPVLCSLLARAPGIPPSFQSVGHLITYRRCEFPEVPLCGPRLKVCFPTPISGSPFGGSDRWVFLSHPSSWSGLGNRRRFLGTDWGGGARKGDKGISWGFLCPVLAAQAGL